MTMHSYCSVCGKEVDVFELKSHKCVPKQKLVSDLTVEEFKELLGRGNEPRRTK